RLFLDAVRFVQCPCDYLGDWMVRKMSDKERLEEVVENVVFLRGLTGSLNAELPEDDFWYLYEQAERVQGLEKRIKKELEYVSKYNGKLKKFLQKRKLPPNTLGRHVVEVIMNYVEELEKQNKRYREAIEYIQREIRKAIYTPKKQKWNSDFEREFESGKTRGLIQASDIVKEAIEILEGEK